MNDQMVILTKNQPTSTGPASLAYVDVYPGEDERGLRVLISVLPHEYGEESHRHMLHIGDTFPVRDQVWRVVAIKDRSAPEDPHHNWAVLLNRDS